MTSKEKCAVLVKPDAIDRRLQFNILSRISNIAGIKCIGNVFKITSAEKIYGHLLNQKQLAPEERSRLRSWLMGNAIVLAL
uniref:Nucleoside diphosphate kinase-like domain-containing protein n=1 Tax=Ditylenchus dipsaci TaxID=166011 RepID=A0A915EB13_9BILA